MISLALLLAFAPDSWGQSKQPPAQNKAAQSPAPDQRGTEQAPSILSAQDAKDQADKFERERERQDKAKVDEKLASETQRIADFTRWLAAFTAGLVAVALAQAGLFVWQLRYMRKGMKDAENAARAANDAATAAKEQVEAAKAQIEVTKIGIFDLERAYLDAAPREIITRFVMDPPPASVVYQQGDPMEVAIKIGMLNAGRTRAAITRAYGEFSQAEISNVVCSDERIVDGLLAEAPIDQKAQPPADCLARPSAEALKKEGRRTVWWGGPQGLGSMPGEL